MLSNGSEQTWNEIKVQDSKKENFQRKIFVFVAKKNIFINVEISEDRIEHVETRKSTTIKNTTEQFVILTLPPPPDEPLQRDLWANKVEFLLSVIGYVVDLGKKTIRMS